jgi:superfamily II RNA helicase
MSINMCSREEKDAIATAIGRFRFSAGFGRILSRLVRHGIGVHHAGMLPKYRRLVETLAQRGLLKVICGTDTLGVGINVPIRTVVITSLSKYDGTKVRLLSVREFHQIAGRAGRAGYDTAGRVVVQAPEHVIDNEKALAKAGDDPKKRRKVVRKKPPEGMVSWGAPTYERLVAGEPETLTSHFRMSTSMVLNLLARPGDVRVAVEELVTATAETEDTQQRQLAEAEEILGSLETAGIVERLAEPDRAGRTMRLTVDLQPDFALNQPLSQFALAAIELLDRESPTYVVDVVSVIEATLENPRQILSAQRNRARGEAVAAMKAEGIEYEARMELLEDVTHPKPLETMLEGAFAIYREGHPWVADFELAPKSVVREMFEQAMNFADYVQFYGLARSEGVVLRYLADASRALRQTVPEDARTEELEDLLAWLSELVRQIDSSLLDEWERLMNPEEVTTETSVLDERPPPVTANVRAFRVLVRNALFRRVELAARKQWLALGELDGEDGFDAHAWAAALAPYFEEFDEIGTGPDARGPALLLLDQQPGRWTARQIFDDPAGAHDWGFSAEIDLAASDEAGVAVVHVTAVNQL